ncbi:hypothetical protein [Limnoglobus roseus]|uniref:hypothetical protein n=1 Tax=Limnoglobus roseus TaxID=2598579 RepID=UPI0011EAF5B2|nr:hypothetical protein [Limnoglobus roseus]
MRSPCIEPWEKCLHHHPLNLINLCTKCHTGFDIERRISTLEVQAAKERLLERLLMSRNSQADVRDPTSLASICKAIVKLLEENRVIFENFGPESPLAETSFEFGADRVWKQRRKDTILPNNKKIVIILNSHRHLYDSDESFRLLVETYIAHEMSYESFVMSPSKSHDNFRFPKAFAERVYKEAA